MNGDTVLTFQKELIQGLRRDEKGPRNVGGLIDCQNCKCFPGVLAPADQLSKAFTLNQLATYGVAVGWPYPQLFRGENVTLLATAGAVWSVVEGPTWSPTLIATVPALPQDIWHFVSLGPSWFMMNGQTIVYRTLRQNLPDVTWTDRIIVNEHHPISAACQFKGRVLMGGFGEEAWGIWSGLPQNAVWWSSIGGGDVFWGWMPHESVTVPDDELLSSYEQNTMGYTTMPWRGRVLCLKGLGDAVVAYGADGISALLPFVEPTPTFGTRHLADIGIAGRGAVGGDERRHVFLDTTGCLWSLDSQLKLERLGYQEFLDPSTFSGTRLIVYDPSIGDFYIGNGTLGFVLSDYGLGKTEYLPTSIIQTGESITKAIVLDSLVTPVGKMIFKTDTFNFGDSIAKVLHTVQVGVVNPLHLSIVAGYVTTRIGYRTSAASAWKNTELITLDGEGRAVVNVTGSEFYVEVIVDTSATTYGVAVEYVKVSSRPTAKHSMKRLLA